MTSQFTAVLFIDWIKKKYRNCEFIDQAMPEKCFSYLTSITLCVNSKLGNKACFYIMPSTVKMRNKRIKNLLNRKKHNFISKNGANLLLA